MASNPLIERYRWSVKSPQFWLSVGFYVVAVALIIGINWALHIYQRVYVDFEELCRFIYYHLFVVLVLISCGWTTFRTGSTLAGEVTRKTYDFLRLLPLSACQKVLGILIGRNLMPLIFTGMTCVFLLLFGYFAGINRAAWGEAILVVFSVAMLLNLVVLLASTSPDRRKKQSSAMTILLLVLLAPLSIAGIGALIESQNRPEQIKAEFFFLHIPLLIVVALIALYLCAWLFVGTIRKLTFEQRPLFSDEGAILFVLGYSVLILGFLWPHLYLRKDAGALTCAYWVLSAVPITFVPFGCLRNFDNYLEYTRFFPDAECSPATNMWRVIRHSNIALGVLMFAVYAIPAVLVAIMTGFSEAVALRQIGLLFSFYFFLLLLMELGAVYQPSSNKIGIALGVLTVLYLVLPSIAAAITEKENLAFFSPVGSFYMLVMDYSGQCSLMFKDVLLVNVLLCLLPLLLIWRRYRYLLSMRRKM